MGINCALLDADFFLFCCEGLHVVFLLTAIKLTLLKCSSTLRNSRYLDDIISNNNSYSQIYLSELQLNKGYSCDTQTPYFDFVFSITNGIIL